MSWEVEGNPVYELCIWKIQHTDRKWDKKGVCHMSHRKSVLCLVFICSTSFSVVPRGSTQ